MSPAPTPPAQRLESLDVLRGLALFGVLLENLQHFVEPSYSAWALSDRGTTLDRAVLFGIRALCDNKVYMLFALLLGYGIGLQRRRAESRGERFAGMHALRMLALGVIGLAHSMLWDGDILLTYAALGLVLLPLAGAPDGALRAVAGLLLLLPLLAFGGALAGSGLPAARLEELAASGLYPLRQTCFALAMLLLGLEAGRANRLAQGPPAPLARAFPAALVVAVAAQALGLWLMATQPARGVSSAGLALEASIAVGAPALVAVYLVLALRAEQRPLGRRLLAPFAPVGRATLTNYLLQSVIGVGLLLRIGDAPPGPITPPVGVLLTCAIFALQVVASRWWLARFTYGPVEWLWRSATYSEWLPLRASPRSP